MRLSLMGVTGSAARLGLSWNKMLTPSAVVSTAPADKLKRFFPIFLTPSTN
jgi:hypothetical protein